MYKKIYYILQNHNPLRYIWGRLLLATGLGRNVIIYFENIKIRFHPSSMSFALYLDKHFRIQENDLFCAILCDGDICIDGGANIGHLSLLMSRYVGIGGKVLSIEANPKVFKYLEENIILNSPLSIPIEAICIALGEKQGLLHFDNATQDDMNHISTNNQGIPVIVDTLDNLSRNFSYIKLLKLDIEGYEVFALKGGLQTLKKTKYIYIEASAYCLGRYGFTKNDLYNILYEQFEIFRIIGKNKQNIFVNNIEIGLSEDWFCINKYI